MYTVCNWYCGFGSRVFLCNCLEKYVKGLRDPHKKIETFPCPTCCTHFTLKLNEHVAGMPSSYFITNMLYIMEIQNKAKASTLCFFCGENPAFSYCTSCEMFMCKTCSNWHNRWPAYKRHDVLSIKDLGNPKKQIKMRRKLYCVKHRDRILEYFCETCNELCCIDCVVLDHTKPEHSCVIASEVERKQKKTLELSCCTLYETKYEGNKALNNICEVKKTLKDNAKITKIQIKAKKKSILKMLEIKLNEKEEELIKEVNKVYDELDKELSEQQSDIEEFVNKVQAFVPFPRNLLNGGSIEEILSSQKLIDENLEMLENEKPQDLEAVNDGVICHVPGRTAHIYVDAIVGELGCVEGMRVLYTAKSEQPATMLLKTGLNNILLPTLFMVVNSIEQNA